MLLCVLSIVWFEKTDDGFFMPFFNKKTLPIGVYINTTKTSEVNEMETGSKCGPDPDGRNRRPEPEWNPFSISAA